MTTLAGADTQPRCICWDGPVLPHEGHCCFDTPAGGIKPGRPLPCGHCVHEMQPATTAKRQRVCKMCGHEEVST